MLKIGNKVIFFVLYEKEFDIFIGIHFGVYTIHIYNARRNNGTIRFVTLKFKCRKHRLVFTHYTMEICIYIH